MLWEINSILPKAVTLFGLINNVEVIIDSDLERYDKIVMHPNINIQSLIMSFNGLKKFLESSENDIRYIKL